MTLSYFEEIEKQIISKISSSQSSVFVAVAWFTNQLLFDSLTDATTVPLKWTNRSLK